MKEWMLVDCSWNKYLKRYESWSRKWEQKWTHLILRSERWLENNQENASEMDVHKGKNCQSSPEKQNTHTHTHTSWGGEKEIFLQNLFMWSWILVRLKYISSRLAIQVRIAEFHCCRMKLDRLKTKARILC